jgi:hypothetical protein
MIIVGIDAHKRTHTLVAVDDAGRKLAEHTVSATPKGHLHVLQWSTLGRAPVRRRGLPPRGVPSRS